MGFWHKHKLVELLIDPSSGQLSMSRTLLPYVFILDAIWLVLVCYHIPKDTAVAPISSMLSMITGALCGIYGLSTFGGSISSVVSQWTGSQQYPGGTAPKATKPPEA